MNCPGCGHPIQICHDVDGNAIPLETFPEMTGERRWTVVKFGVPAEGKPHTVAAVKPDSPVSAYTDHRVDCPAGENGRADRLRV